MSKAHFIAPAAVLVEDGQAVRLGSTGAGKFNQLDVGKLVKLSAESAYDLTASGDAIEGFVAAVETATSNGFTVGSIIRDGVFFVIADGLQATPGTGTLAVGDYVVTGSVQAKNTALPLGFPRVCKATDQPTAVPAALANVGPQIRNSIWGWRVVSLGTVGTGVPGTVVAIERTC